jgi:ATP-dependent Clp protease adaptor protein ClpS
MTTDTIIDKKETTKYNLKEPSMYKVIVFNDDYTPMEFVIAMFISVFRKSQDEAIDLTLKIHNDGMAVAGIYTSEIAEQKSTDASELARAHGHPLIVTVEKE